MFIKKKFGKDSDAYENSAHKTKPNKKICLLKVTLSWYVNSNYTILCVLDR